MRLDGDVARITLNRRYVRNCLSMKLSDESGSSSSQVPDADQGAGVSGFATEGELWQTRRAFAVDFWSR